MTRNRIATASLLALLAGCAADGTDGMNGSNGTSSLRTASRMTGSPMSSSSGNPSAQADFAKRKASLRTF